MADELTEKQVKALEFYRHVQLGPDAKIDCQDGKKPTAESCRGILPLEWNVRKILATSEFQVQAYNDQNGARTYIGAGRAKCGHYREPEKLNLAIEIIGEDPPSPGGIKVIFPWKTGPFQLYKFQFPRALPKECVTEEFRQTPVAETAPLQPGGS